MSAADLGERWIARLRRLSGWKRRGISFLAGVAAALSFAPFYATPLLAVGFSIFILLLDGAAAHPNPRRTAAGIGWWFGFGYFLMGVYWMAFSFFVQADQFAWMAPFAMLGMPAFLAFFSAGAAAVSMHFWRPGWRRVFVFAFSWMVFEYARGHILTGLPWNLVGQALAGSAAAAQTAAWWGVYGLSLIAILLAAYPAAGFDEQKPNFRGAVVTALGGIALLGVGFARLAIIAPEDHADIVVRIVQPNINQRDKINPAKWGENFLKHLELSRGALSTKARTFVIWPENGVPVLDESDDAMAAVSNALPASAILIAGSVRRDRDAAGAARYYNSLSVFAETPDGRRPILQYDKHHLVPFGEYLPLSGLLRAVGLAQLAPFEEGFTPGEGPRSLRAGGTSFSPLICYEAIFPGEVYPRSDRPAWLVAVTNDAWFGDTSGPRQHLDQARLRAIETGLPMARAANTGVSALIDPRGVYRARAPLYSEGVIDGALPKPLAPTIYARVGDIIFALMMLAVGAFAQMWRKYAQILNDPT